MGAIEIASVDPDISRKLAISMLHIVDWLERLIIECQRDQLISIDINLSATVRTLLAMVQGMRVLICG